MRYGRILGGLLAGAAATALLSGTAAAQKPQYGGTLEIGTVSAKNSALSWDPGDYAWKINHEPLLLSTGFWHIPRCLKEIILYTILGLELLQQSA